MLLLEKVGFQYRPPTLFKNMFSDKHSRCQTPFGRRLFG
jgi:hypothetical protein